MDTLTADMLAAVLQEPEKALLARVLTTLGLMTGTVQAKP